MKNSSAGLAPIALFAYNRVDHTRQTVEALKNNTLADQSSLYIFSDGPKTDRDKGRIEELRRYLKRVDGFKEIIIVEREKNLGLANSIIDGVSQVVDRYGKIIVLEDDIVTSPCFLQYMNNVLGLYEDNDRIGSISGYMFPVEFSENELFFLPMIGSWGWGTWKSAWHLFEPDGAVLLKEITEARQVDAFNLDGTYPYLKMLRDQIKGKNDSWAIRWNASLFVNKKLTVWPSKTLVANIGFDGSGTHCNRAHYGQGHTLLASLPDMPRQDVQISRDAYMLIKRYLLQKGVSRLTFSKMLDAVRNKIFAALRK